MRINIDQSACIECGTCNATCPKVFNLNEEGKAYVIEGADLDANLQCIKEAVNICPAQVIIMV
ncbi:MAG: ferredoxin [bacterium]